MTQWMLLNSTILAPNDGNIGSAAFDWSFIKSREQSAGYFETPKQSAAAQE